MFEFMLCWVLLSFVTNECSHFFPLYFLLISVCNIKRWTSLCLSRRLRTRFSDSVQIIKIFIYLKKKKITNHIYFIFFLILYNNVKKKRKHSTFCLSSKLRFVRIGGWVFWSLMMFARVRDVCEIGHRNTYHSSLLCGSEIYQM